METPFGLRRNMGKLEPARHSVHGLKLEAARELPQCRAGSK